jgi:nicotine blue oxidoreductase
MDTKGEVAGLLLAAGGGRRLGGRPKALLTYEGRPLVEHAVRVLRAGGCGPVHVVLGAAASEVRERADLSGCVLVDNPHWEEGMGSSLRVGLASLAGAAHESRDAPPGEPPGAAGTARNSPDRPAAQHTGPRTGPPTPAATVITLVDQPGVPAEAVARVIAAARAGDDLVSALVSAVFGPQRSHPVLFGASRWAGVASSAGEDRGARTYLREHAELTVLVECGDLGHPDDIDTPADLRLLTDPARRATKR